MTGTRMAEQSPSRVDELGCLILKLILVLILVLMLVLMLVQHHHFILEPQPDGN